MLKVYNHFWKLDTRKILMLKLFSLFESSVTFGWRRRRDGTAKCKNINKLWAFFRRGIKFKKGSVWTVSTYGIFSPFMLEKNYPTKAQIYPVILQKYKWIESRFYATKQNTKFQTLINKLEGGRGVVYKYIITQDQWVTFLIPLIK